MSDSTTLLVIIAVTVILFISGRIPVALVALGVTAALFFTGLVNLEQAFAGFGDPIIIFIAGLFVVAVGLESTGITAWVGQWLAGIVKGSRLRLSVLGVLIVALLSPLISMSGAVAAFVPVVTLLALKLGDAPSKYLIPLAFASGAGSKLALTGTPKNVLIADAAVDAGYSGFGFFEFAWVGVPLLLGTILVVALFGRRLLPDRQPASLPADFGRHAETLVESYGIGAGATHLRVGETSPFVGEPREAVVARTFDAVDVVTVAEGRTGEPLRRGAISPGDVLVVRGSDAATAAFAADKDLASMGGADGNVADTLFNRNSGLAEVVVPPRSPLVGATMSPGMVTESGDLVVLAIHRNGEALGTAQHGEVVQPEPAVIRAGDQLLLQGSWAALDRRLKASEVLVVDEPDTVRRQAVPLGIGSQAMLAIVAAMVVVLATGIVPAAVGVLLAAMAVVGLRILTVEQAYRSIDWNTIVLVAAMMPLATAMQQSGTAEGLAELLVRWIGDQGPLAVLVGLFLFTAILGQVISNTATALILIPIAVATAIEFNISPLPVLMSLNVGAAAAFLTPVATPPNLIVMGPGGYRFGDYWKLGLALLVLYFFIAVFWVPLIWPLTPAPLPL